MKPTLLNYIESFNASDTPRIVSLFSEDATIEDPVGTPLKRGRAEITAFYAHATSLGARLELIAPPRGSHSNAATITFKVHIKGPEGTPAHIDVTDVMEFNTEGKITSMRAYWGPDDYHIAEEK
ncbi:MULTISPECIES: nuclear transport factor 2 family protein [unclassified Paraburkholderia]|uniref:nuclear transport factor 2 family protein n=1 Tax=unclassified Paraburkholderia TaxID=2615204 RepID=UPI002AAFF9FC|nr:MULTISPECIES: nuclear transport factor 2 family protein [unclassified Paraburkholderia]